VGEAGHFLDMSSPAPGGSGSPEDDKATGLNKYVKRVRTVLQRGKSNRGSVSSIGEITGGAGSPAAASTTPSSAPKTTPTASAPKATPPAEKSSTVGTATAKPEAPKPAAVGPKATKQEKARALFEKYGLTLEPHEWALSSREPGERIEKPIRMRIHRQCHRCMTTFGPDKVCANCQHTRCKKCPRYPARKSKDAKGKSRTAGVAGVGAGAAGSDAEKLKSQIRPKQLTRPSRTGGQDLVRRPIVQRVHRKCHRCQKDFAAGERICSSCSHVRCKKCPRDPPKLKKYPNGYPGDAEPEPEIPVKQRTYRKIRTRVRWYCHSCSNLFAESSKTCSTCNHERCPDCTRVPAKKIKPPPDPEVLRSLEAKLANMGFSGSSTMPGAA